MFRVNDFLLLKLEREETVLYIDYKPFIQCKFLLLNIPIDEATLLSDIESIDEAQGRLDSSMEEGSEKKVEIPPETEFWGHCSNLQVWAESNYDTRLLHRSIAFQLLKALTDAGDPIAKRVFKEEIVKRIKSGYRPVITYLLREFYVYFMDGKEIEKEYIFFLDVDEFEVLLDDLQEEIKGQIEEFLFWKIRNPGTERAIKEKCLEFLEKFDKPLNLRFVEIKGEKFYVDKGVLKIQKRKLTNLLDLKGVNKLADLNELNLSHNEIDEIENLGILRGLETLLLANNRIKEIKGLGLLSNLKELNLSGKRIIKIEGLDNLEQLEHLNLSRNQIVEIERFKKLKNLKYLGLGNNQIRRISGLENLINLEVLDLKCNQIKEFKGFKAIKELRLLILSENFIKEIPDFSELDNIKEVYLDYNPISKEQIKILKKKFKSKIIV
jgi:hypothetical protein